MKIRRIGGTRCCSQTSSGFKNTAISALPEGAEPASAGAVLAQKTLVLSLLYQHLQISNSSAPLQEAEGIRHTHPLRPLIAVGALLRCSF